jgi:hypothetical protein
MIQDTVGNPAKSPMAGRRRGRRGLRLSASPRIRSPQSAVRKGGCLCLFIILSLAGILSARYGSSAAGPVSRGTVPPSRYGSGLVSTPNPVDSTSNLVVTGNVGGGKAFRGAIPYNSATSFGGRLGSTSLDPFLRYSAVPDELNDAPAGYTPFYSSTGTVPKIQPGYSGVFAPGSPRVAGVPMQFRSEQPADLTAPAETLPSQAATGRMARDGLGDSFLLSSGRSQTSSESIAPQWSRTPEEMRRLVAGAPGGATTERLLAPQSKQIMTSDEYQRQLEQLQRDFDRVKTNASQFEQDLRAGQQMPAQTPGQTIEPKSTEPVQPMISAETLRRIIRPESQAQDQSLTARPAVSQDPPASSSLLVPDGSVADQTQGQTAGGSSELVFMSPQNPLNGVRTSPSEASRSGPYGQPALGQPTSEQAAQKNRIAAVFAPRTEETATEKAGATTGNLRLSGNDAMPALRRVEETARAFDAPGRLIEHPLQDSTSRVPSSTDSARTEPSGGPDGFDPPASDRPKAHGQISAPVPPAGALPVNPDPVSKEKFDRVMKSAQADLRQGRYPQAAESFALAGVYRPRDAGPQLGRSRALLAAGEYLGSAVCLAKAIELDPRSILATSDLARSNLFEAIGGPDQFVRRITDLEGCAKTNSAPALQLLLAYIYQQMDRPQQAKDAVQAARKGLQSSTSLDLLEAAIGTRG